MKTTVIVLAAAVASAASAAIAQGYPGYQVYRAPSTRANGAPRFPEPPRPPELAAPPAFKPFKGQHLYSDRGGLNPYPAPRKPRGGFSTYGH